MTRDPITLPVGDTIRSAAHRMHDADVGAVRVEPDGSLRGILTDRDITIRVVAEGIDPDSVTVGQALSGDLVTVGPQDSIGDAIAVMRDGAVRRIAVVDDGVAVGVLSLGDLAESRDPESILGEISTAPPND
ncbi:MAG: CBS domain-containing protein [Nitriliruptoraceae bacterium]